MPPPGPMQPSGSRPPVRIAVFVSPHGFGHAARASALMLGLARQLPALSFDLYTTVPDWFFQQSGIGRFSRFPLMCDIGLVQRSPMEEDLAASLERLVRFYPPRRNVVRRLADRLLRRRCRLVICDIAPLGLAVAKTAGLPGILVENFTWDWIYEGYRDRIPGFGSLAAELKALLEMADGRIQTEPLCRPTRADLTVGPIGRPFRRPRSDTRALLGVPQGAPVVLVTMGGVRQRHLAMAASVRNQPIVYIVPGVFPDVRRQGNCIFLPHRSDHYHPDLVAAADAVVAKAGYSTIAETHAAGVPLGYILRPGFRESAVLETFIRGRMPSLKIPAASLNNGSWIEQVPDLLSLERQAPPGERPDRQTAGFLIARYGDRLG
jgi:hypothetical protein